jgi:tryptophan synthase beta chain
MEPDANGYFGRYGGRYVPEVLVEPLREVEAAMREAFADDEFWRRYHGLLRDYVGRPTPLTPAPSLRRRAGEALIALKREDCNHTGAHKILNAMGQALLAQRLGKSRIIAETGAGQHGVAVATAGAALGLPVEVYMGAADTERQALNVYLMRLLGARVHEVTSGSRTLKDAINEALRDWAGSARETFYIIGSVVGPHPYPWLVRSFVRIIGDEARAQCLQTFGRLPDHVVACVGGGSNAIGIFSAFLDDTQVNLWGVEAGGSDPGRFGQHSASLSAGRTGILHGARTLVLMDEDGLIAPTHSVSAGLDYPAVGPEHAYLKDTGRVRYVSIPDDEALEAFRIAARATGIVPALESAHAVAYALRLAAELDASRLVLVNLSGRGEKDALRLAGGVGPPREAVR